MPFIEAQLTVPLIDFYWFWSTLFHRLALNEISDSGAIALADALRMNQSLETLK